jgi:cytochrome b6-f complex iron-sulfur subunit
MAMADVTHSPARSGGITRREFLNYTWGASLALALSQTIGAIVWYVLPVRYVSERISVSDLPLPDGYPLEYKREYEGRPVQFWLVNVGPVSASRHAARELQPQGAVQGISALHGACTHMNCPTKWVAVNWRFECPCHGAKYWPNGAYIEGPAPRNFDRLVVRLLDAGERELARTNANGDPVPLVPGTVWVVVQVEQWIRGAPHA